MKMTLAVLAMVMAVAAPAVADAGVSRATVEIARDFARGEFERALDKAEKALKTTTDATELGQLHLLRAQAFLALGQSDRARAAFGLAVQKDPTVSLDKGKANPDAVKLLEQVRGETPATLVVLVKAGDDAEVAVDDKHLGPAPLQTQVPGGVHVVLARGVDGRTTRVEMQVPPGRKVVLELELNKPGKGRGQGGAGTSNESDGSGRETGDAMAESQTSEDDPDAGTTGTSSGGVRDGRGDGWDGRTTEVSGSPRPLRSASAGLWIGGGVFVVAGVVALIESGVLYGKLSSPTAGTLGPGEGEAIATTGATLQGLGWVGVGVGAAAAAVGGVLWWLDSKGSGPRVGVVVTPTGAWAGVRGELPW
jgi:hypothetical protein